MANVNEITKLYKNAGVLKECLSPCYINKTWRKTHDCPNCDNRENYPPFTAEKQLELIKWLLYNAKVDCLNMFYKDEENYLEISINCKNGYSYENSFDDNFEIAMASVINTLWQSLTEEEKEAIRGILRA